jgi:hypothetical protein
MAAAAQPGAVQYPRGVPLSKSAVSLSAVALVIALGVSHSFAAEQDALASEAKISQEQATRTALAKVPGGVIKSAELEREHGKLVWSFDLAQAGKRGVTEVMVDALTGKIVSLKKETDAEEAREAAAEAKGK